MKWTQEQASAIDKRGSNILVSAAAGSGKTAVLVERIKKLILGADGAKPVSADRLLVVTFTEAAASEMRQKIIDAVAEEREESDSEYLRGQLRRLHFANISTFHAFALSI
ncbi:MAG: UvrD-helicase domain-containing protein, partial [Clostridiales Family XIII bacterium]|nr:UvrD-helicase domain-containing protein [Clostridiales Family XIII bacterium]